MIRKMRGGLIDAQVRRLENKLNLNSQNVAFESYLRQQEKLLMETNAAQ